jgi:5-carboxyvanillate decarboxylase
MISEPNRIATEEAFAIPEQLDGYRALGRSTWSSPDIVFWHRVLSHPDNGLEAKLLDLDQRRLADMDSNAVDMQVLLLTSPGVQVFEPDTASGLARLANDRLAEAIIRHPDRLAGLAALAPHAGADAAAEMDRAVTRLGLNGFVINSHTAGEYLDAERFWPILEAAEALERPIYIHPRPLPQPAVGPYLDHELWAGIWGYAVETGLHALRMIIAGVFDRFPRLQIVLGHLGEGLPYWIYRMDYMYVNYLRPVAGRRLELTPGEYLRRNFLITTSGMNHEPPLALCRTELGSERIMWAIDYPYQRSRDAVSFLDSASLPEEERAAIYADNALRAFHIETPAAVGA